ncbi:hypothetical protein OE88DRAFT_1810445, partial [Heliocybe sulcata]
MPPKKADRGIAALARATSTLALQPIAGSLTTSWNEGLEKADRTRSAAIASTIMKDALTVVASLADGGVNVPFLKGSAQIAVQLIDAAQLVKNNQDDCRDVARLAAETVLHLADAVKGRDPESIDERLKAEILRFEKKLQEIYEGVNKLTHAKFYTRAATRTMDQAMINGWKAEMDHAHRQFLRGVLVDLAAGKVEVKTELGQLSNTMDTMRGQISGIHGIVMQTLPRQDLAKTNIFLSRTPPPKPSIFCGRDQETSDAVHLLTSKAISQPNLAILGSGGMGKTSLALTILHHAAVKAHFKDQVYFVPCESAQSTEQLVYHIATVLPFKKQEEDILTSIDSFLHRSSRLLLILDNFETPYYQAKMEESTLEVLKRMTSIPGVSLILTMRASTAPHGIQWDRSILLHGLPMEASRQAFLGTSHSSSEQTVIDQLLKELDGVPLAIKLISNLAQLDSPANLLKEWQERKTAMLAEPGRGRLENIEVSIELSLQATVVQDCQDAIPLLALIAHLPDGLLQAKDTLEKKAPYIYLGPAARRALKQAALMDDSGEQMNILSPVRHYICKKYPLDAPGREALEDYYEALIGKYNQECYTSINDTLLLESSNIIAIIKQACSCGKVSTKVAQMAYKMSWFLLFYRPTIELLDAIQHAAPEG